MVNIRTLQQKGGKSGSSFLIILPKDCVVIQKLSNGDPVVVAEREDGSRRTTRYDIDLFKCIYCGFCEEACPVDAIVETRVFEYEFQERGPHIRTKEDLLAFGDEHEEQIAADRAVDAKYR